MTRPIVVILAAVAFLAAACASTGPYTPTLKAYRTWREAAANCYLEATKDRVFLPPIWRGRVGVEACDLYVEDMRYEEQRQDRLLETLLFYEAITNPQ